MGARLRHGSGRPAPASTGNRRLYAGPGIEIEKMVWGQQGTYQAPRHALAVLGMQTDVHFAKIICEFFVLIPKLAFVSR